MKKILVFTITLTLLLGLMPGTIHGAQPLRVLVNNQLIKFPDAQPFIDGNGRTQVPARFVSEALGATVGWDADTKTVTITRDSDNVSLTIGKKEITVNGQVKQLDTEALIKQDRTFVPVRFVSEALGAEVKWEPSILTAYITLKNNTSISSEMVEHKGGYLVPKDSTLLVSDYDSKNVEQSFEINFLRSNVEQQKLDLKNAIASKFGDAIADEVNDHIRKKTEPKVYLEEKIIYLESTKQYIVIWGSKGRTIDVDIYLPSKDIYNLD